MECGELCLLGVISWSATEETRCVWANDEIAGDGLDGEYGLEGAAEVNSR